MTINSPQRAAGLAGPAGPELDPAALAGYAEHPPRVRFFTDTSVCIGCKACEVACKEWNAVPEDGLTLTAMS
jgi:formate dehydrogenase iron-sulfur subunit